MSTLELPLCPKIGQVADGEDKFQSWSGQYGYYRRSEVRSDPYKTDKTLNETFDTEALKLNKTVCATLAQTNKSTVNKKSTGVKVESHVCLKRTNSMESFVSQRDWLQAFLDRGTAENFSECFSYFALSDRENLMPVVKVAKMVKMCLGDDCPEFILDRFIQKSNRSSLNGLISWDSFRDLVLPTVLVAVEAECSMHREMPALLKLMNRPRIVDQNVGPLGDSSTTYRDNFNRKNEIVIKDRNPDFSYHNPKYQDDSVVQLNDSAKLLCAGTIKGTHQLPGFRGHMPANVRNQRKFQHSFGLITHPIDNNLRLTQRGMGCVLGYTGHQPKEVKGQFNERQTACDPRTTTGASYGTTRAYL